LITKVQESEKQIGHTCKQGDLPLLERALVFVSFDHVASRVVDRIIAPLSPPVLTLAIGRRTD
jgi:hypothetical protein